MVLVDKLEELDQAIWKQYEKVTNYCNKEYGWNKYDLARLSNSADNCSYLGAGVYLAITGYNGSSVTSFIVGALVVPFSMLNYHGQKKSLTRDEELEGKLLEITGAAKPVVYKSWRPLNFGLVAYSAYRAYSSFTGGQQLPESFSMSPEEYNNLSGMSMALLTSFFFFQTSKKYFQDQIMTPPKKKKSVLKSLYEKAAGKLPAAPQPQLEPTKYQSIDDAVGGA